MRGCFTITTHFEIRCLKKGTERHFFNLKSHGRYLLKLAGAIMYVHQCRTASTLPDLCNTTSTIEVVCVITVQYEAGQTLQTLAHAL